jgi:hypothetical protein
MSESYLGVFEKLPPDLGLQSGNASACAAVDMRQAADSFKG